MLRPGGVLIFSSHNPRSILVRPAWSRERLRAFATRLVGGRIAWSHAAVVFLTPVKALHASLRAAGISIMRVFRRLAMSAFWRGEGSLLDSAHGGLITHYWIPERAIAEVSQIGFQLVTSMGDDFPRSSHPFVTDWYYYVFQK